MFFNDLYATFVYLICAFVVSYVAFGISFFFGIRNADSNKVVAYECGFTPFDDARNTFEVHFYLVAILFLMFDLEISFIKSIICLLVLESSAPVGSSASRISGLFTSARAIATLCI